MSRPLKWGVVGLLAIGAAATATYIALPSRDAPTADALVEDSELSSNPDAWHAGDISQSEAAEPVVSPRRSVHQMNNLIGEMPSGSAAEVVARLRPLAASGDSKAAALLFLKLDECRRAHLRREQLSKETFDEGGGPCAGLSREEITSGAGWLDKAAAAGLVEAQLIYAANSEPFIGREDDVLRNPERVIEYKRKAMRYLVQAAGNGSVEALQSLASAYRYGLLVQRDPTQAYAYVYAANRAIPSREAEQSARQYRSELTPQQSQQGARRGEEIYQACCRQ